MADYPTMPLRTDALIGDTMHLTATEFGGYVRLLVAMWRNGSTLPDDDTRLMRFSGMTAREWGRSRDVLLAFLMRTENGDWTQKRLRKEWLAVTAKCEQAARAINTRWLKTKKTCDTDVSPPNYARNTIHDPVSIEPTNVVSIPRKRVIDPPEFVDFWAAYPRKVAKGNARKAWDKAMKTADPPTIIAAARRVEDRGEYTPHPATWLNAERWLDEETTHAPDHRQPSKPQSSRLEAFLAVGRRRDAMRGAGGD